MSDIQALQNEIEGAKAVVQRRDLALKLSENREFRVLFTEEYFGSEIARLMVMSVDSNVDAETRADCVKMAEAAARTKQYLSMVIQAGAHYERTLPEMEATLQEMLVERDAEEETR